MSFEINKKIIKELRKKDHEVQFIIIGVAARLGYNRDTQGKPFANL